MNISTMHNTKKTLLAIFTFLAINVNAQNVNIPDANFKTYLVGHASINTNGDTEIQMSEAIAFSGNINCDNLSISDMTGIEAFTSITQLLCHSNSIVTLDLSQNYALTTLWCHQNQLNSLNVANGNNTNFTSFYAQTNTNLTCIQVDDVSYSSTNWTWIDAGASFSLNCGGAPCTVNIPDVNFKTYLVGNAAINTNGDTEIQCSEASSFNGDINCFNLSISDLTGIEAFIALTELTCHSNPLSTFDISQNTSLTYLKCGGSALTNVSLDQNTALTELDCRISSITTIDLSQNTQLVTLNIGGNGDLASVDVSGCTVLNAIYANGCEIASIDLTNNPSLLRLDIRDNYDLANVDVSSNQNLIYLRVSGCDDLISLNVANGNNANFISFTSENTPMLNCIQVDDVAYSNTNWTLVDTQNYFSLNCLGAVLVSSIAVQGQAGATTITTQNGTLQMEATVLPANADDVTYTWSVIDGSGSASINTNGLLTAITDGTVTVIANANDGSGIAGTATITMSNQSVGLGDFESKNISIYPNPAANELFVDVTEGQINKLEIIDYTGRIVKTVSDNNHKNIDVSDLTQGVYILKISTENGISTQQFIKK